MCSSQPALLNLLLKLTFQDREYTQAQLAVHKQCSDLNRRPMFSSSAKENFASASASGETEQLAKRLT